MISRTPASGPTPVQGDRAVRGLALFGTLAATFDLVHDVMDQWGQSSWASSCKGLHGDHSVYADGTTVDAEPGRAEPTTTATALGRRAVTHHVASYTAGQAAAAIVVTRALGYRLPLRALLAGAAINAATHWVIDRREPLYAAARVLGKDGYLHAATVVRTPGGPAQLTGPGTASFELDRSAHRLIGLAATALSTWLALRGTRR